MCIDFLKLLAEERDRLCLYSRARGHVVVDCPIRLTRLRVSPAHDYISVCNPLCTSVTLTTPSGSLIAQTLIDSGVRWQLYFRVLVPAVSPTHFSLHSINTQKYPFSINLDESTTNGDRKVLSILVSYFNPDRKMVHVGHLGSLEVLKVSALKLEKLLEKSFEENNIPWSNLVSMLKDSCSVMRGIKMGLETRIRQNHCPSLLDVDSNSCHHIHNAAKVLAAPYSNHLEKLFSNLHTDHQWATDQVRIQFNFLYRDTFKFRMMHATDCKCLPLH